MEQNHDYASHKKLMKVMQTMIFFIEHFELIVILIKRRVYSRVVEKPAKPYIVLLSISSQMAIFNTKVNVEVILHRIIRID